MKVLTKNELILPSPTKIPEEPPNPNPSQIDITSNALLKVLMHYNIAPAACTHIRGQEQVYGSRLTHDDNGQLESIGP